jgi:pyruvate dehydrogenase E1 component
LLARDASGLLIKRFHEVVDGEYQTYRAHDGAYLRKEFFGKYPQLLKLVEHMTDDQLWNLRRGGLDPVKVFNAYRNAMLTTGPTASNTLGTRATRGVDDVEPPPAMLAAT